MLTFSPNGVLRVVTEEENLVEKDLLSTLRTVSAYADTRVFPSSTESVGPDDFVANIGVKTKFKRVNKKIVCENNQKKKFVFEKNFRPPTPVAMDVPLVTITEPPPWIN